MGAKSLVQGDGRLLSFSDMSVEALSAPLLASPFEKVEASRHSQHAKAAYGPILATHIEGPKHQASVGHRSMCVSASQLILNEHSSC